MEFICTKCGRKEAVTTRAAHCACGGLWRLAYEPPKFDLAEIDRNEWSLFRYRRFLALDDESWRSVSMGEGMTPVQGRNQNSGKHRRPGQEPWKGRRAKFGEDEMEGKEACLCYQQRQRQGQP